MDELLNKLLEAEILSEDTKKELEQAFQTKLDEAIDAAKEDASADVRADLTAQWVTERDQLVEAVDAKVSEFLKDEMDELKEDIEQFRDLEAEYAENIVEAKAAMADELKDDLTELVEKVDTFLEIRLEEEVEELREDLELVRQNDFGRRVFEAFVDEYNQSYSDEESASVSLRETEVRLEETSEQLMEAETQLNEFERVTKLERILSPLAGRQREVMEAILKNVDTQQLDEGYKTFIGRVLRETDGDSEKEDKVLADDDGDCGKGKMKASDDSDSDDDSDDSDSDDDSDDSDMKKEGYLVTGDTKATEYLNESSDTASTSGLDHLRKLAGIV